MHVPFLCTLLTSGLRIRQPNVIFPDARAGRIVESVVVLENLGPAPCTWHLRPVGPVRFKVDLRLVSLDFAIVYSPTAFTP